MKNILKKIGILGVIIGMLAPFVELPVVNAEESCTNHLQNYLFLDVNSMDWYGKGDGYKTYAAFKNSFAEGTVKIKSIKKNYVSDTTDDETFWRLYASVLAQPEEYNLSHEFTGHLFVNQNSTGGFEDVTTLVHAYWGKFNEDGTPEKTDWQETASDLTAAGEKTTVQKSGFDIGNDNITIRPAEYTVVGGQERFRSTSTDSSDEGLMSYIESMANNEEETYIAFEITRRFTQSELENKKFGYTAPGGDKYLYGSGAYEDFVTYKAGVKTDNSTDMVVLRKNSTDGTDGDYVAFYWPFILSVEYEVCNTANYADEEWTLEYNSNVTDNSVSNMPSPQSQNFDLGENATVSNTKPKRSGYVFKGWCENAKECSNPLQPGDTVTSDVPTTIRLFAYWAPGGTANNEKTGVISYVIGFISVGVVAGAIYLIARKKNLFKQI